MQKAPIHQSHVYWRIKISQTTLEKGHPRSIPANYFKVPPAISEKKIFLRISSCPYSAWSPNSPEPFLWTDRNFANSFWKGAPKEHSCEIISKSDQWFQRKRFLKDCLKKFHFVTMATRIFDGIKFCEQFLKRTFQGTFLPSLVQIGPAVWEKKMFKEIVDDWRQPQDHPKSPPWACCAQVTKKEKMLVIIYNHILFSQCFYSLKRNSNFLNWIRFKPLSIQS